MQRERLMIARPAILTLAGILVLGWGLAEVAPPYWQSCEMVLLAACAALVWECFHSQELSRKRGKGTFPTSSAGWFTNSAAELRELHTRAFRPWDVEQAVERLNSAGKFALQPVRSDRQSMDQLTNEMLERAFQQNAKKRSAANSRGPLNF